MQIKRLIISILLCFLVCSCAPTDEGPSKYIDPMTDVPELPELEGRIARKLTGIFGPIEEAFHVESLNLTGKKIDIFDLTVEDYYGNVIDFSQYKDKKFLIEIAATYCDHCGQQLKYLPRVRELLDDDIEIFQVFADFDGKNKEYIDEFYLYNESPMHEGITIIPYKKEFIDKAVAAVDISQTPTFMFIDKGEICMSFTSFNETYIEKVIENAFARSYTRDEIIDENGYPLEKFFRTRSTMLSEINPKAIETIEKYNTTNSTLTAYTAGKKISFDVLSNEFDDAYIKLKSYKKFKTGKTLVLGIASDSKDSLASDISKINKFVEENKDINVLVVFLDNPERYEINTSMLYLDLNEELLCDCVSSEASVPYNILEVTDYVSLSNSPMILFVEDTYITGMCVGTVSLMSLNELKDMFYGENCITLIENLNRNY